MAVIPNGQKFHTVSSTVDTTDRGSSELQSQREVYTMQDVIDTVGGTDLKQTTVTLSAAQMLTFNGGGEVEILPAPGANKMYASVEAMMFVDFNSVVYDFAGALGQVVQWKQGASTGFSLNFGVLNSGADALQDFKSINTTASFNSSISIQSTAGVTVTQGDSPVKFSIIYREITF
jgi:hypothetical protein|tara:strand:+ start:377 stop:904 length:528 start_codon:yes stop_codon:yes gene_type:complete